ncbi:hypothetical protein H0H93_010740 [Arthromyces matolae]|nr:hypothetical protein H0H93_010740 [Arthromyces matolae]
MSDTQIAGGYKAAAKNPKVSEEGKAHARQQLNEMVEADANQTKRDFGLDDDVPTGESSNNQCLGANTNVAGGYKATIKNPNVSSEAKAHAHERLQAMGTSADADAEQSAPFLFSLNLH